MSLLSHRSAIDEAAYSTSVMAVIVGNKMSSFDDHESLQSSFSLPSNIEQPEGLPVIALSKFLNEQRIIKH